MRLRTNARCNLYGVLELQLVLSSDVQSFSLADVVSLLHSSGESGFLTFSNQDPSSGSVEKAAYDALESEFESESAPSGNGHGFSSLCSFGSHSLRGAGARATRLLKDWKARR
ncbi:MAG: hypothetical protein VB934_00850 [Polyangiaceae bacterium]